MYRTQTLAVKWGPRFDLTGPRCVISMCRPFRLFSVGHGWMSAELSSLTISISVTAAVLGSLASQAKALYALFNLCAKNYFSGHFAFA
jgi:hypothetical protein